MWETSSAKPADSKYFSCSSQFVKWLLLNFDEYYNGGFYQKDTEKEALNIIILGFRKGITFYF